VERVQNTAVAFNAAAEPIPATAEGKIQYALNTYSKDSMYILNSVSQKTGKSVTELISEWQQNDIFSYLDTAVHENTHSYQYEWFPFEYDYKTDKWITNLAYIFDRNTTYKGKRQKLHT